MKLNQNLLVSILEQFEVTSKYVAQDSVSAYHLAVLADMGYIKCNLAYGVDGSIAGGNIIHITYAGYEALDKMRGANSKLSCDENERKELIEEAREALKDESRQYDKTLYLLASGGIVVALYVAQYCKNNSLSLSLLLFALSIWALAVLLLLLSHATSAHAHDLVLSWCHSGSSPSKSEIELKARFWDNATKYLNIGATVAFILGLFAMVVHIFRIA